jgi:aminoglycoside 3-N-acetyltransferase
MIKVGCSEKDITPKKLLPMAEEKWCGLCKEIKEDIYVKTIIFKDKKKIACIIICDLICFHKDFVTKMRNEIYKKTKIPPKCIMLGTTQNHSAPKTYWETGITSPTGGLLDWFNELESKIIMSVQEAIDDLEEVTIGFGEGKVEGIAGNRRPLGKNGKVIMTWNRPKSEDILDWGLEDPTVKVIKIENLKKETKSILFHFTCHPNVLWANRIISPDFPGKACKIIKKIFGKKVIPIFLNGFCGDIDPFKYMKVPREAYCAPDVFGPNSKVEMCLKESDRFGKMLAGEIIKVFSNIEASIVIENLNTSSIKVKGKLKKEVFYDRTDKLEIMIITLDDKIAFIGVPGEPFLKLELEIEKFSPFLYTFPLGHMNGYSGYLPDRESFEKDGYGVGIGCCNFEPGIGEKIVERTVKELYRLYPFKNVKIVTKSDLRKGIKEVGIKKGDVVMVHSSLSNFGYIEGGAKTIINVLKEIVGKNGTLVFPTFTYSYIDRNNPFNPKKTPSQTGTIPEFFRNQKDVKRSLSPTHSIAVWGKYSELLTKSHDIKRPYSRNGPFGKLYKLNGKILLLGVSEETISFFHAIEDWVGMPYLVDEEAFIENEKGQKKKIKVKNNPPGHRCFKNVFTILENKKLVSKTKIGKADVRVVLIRVLYKETIKILKKYPAILLDKNCFCPFCLLAKKLVNTIPKKKFDFKY